MGPPLQPVALDVMGLPTLHWTDIYPWLLLATGALTGTLTAIGYRFRSAPGGGWFAATMGLTAVWTAGALVTVLSDVTITLVVAEIVMTGCSLTTPVAWLLFVVSYVGFERLLTYRRLAGLFVPPLSGIVAMATSPMTDLYFADVGVVVRPDRISVVSTPPGPLAWVILLYIFVVMVIGLGLIGWTMLVHESLFSTQALWLLAGSLPPFVIAMMEPLGLLDENHLPLMPLGFAVMGVAYGYGLFHHRLFDLSPGTWRIGAETAFDGLSECIVIVDEHGNVLGCNRSACDRFGWEKRDAFGRDIAELEPRLADARDSDRPVEFSDEGHHYEVSVSAITDTWDRGIGDALVVREVTERYEQRQQLSVLNRVLRHNLRNDMMVVASRAETVAETYGDRHAETIVQTAEELLDMAEKARTIENRLGRESSVPSDIDVESLVETVVEDAQAAAGSVPVRWDVDASIRLHADQELLSIVLQNLLENAIEHGTQTEHEGKTTPSPVRLTAERVSGGVRFEVVDDGPGIPDMELAVLKSGTETATEHGTGLGLWLVTWGAAWLDASLEFEVENGTTVTLVVPDQ